MIKNQIINSYDINPNKIKVIYSGIGSKEINFHSSFEKLSEEYSITADNAVFLFVGSGFKRKGVLEFLQIIAKLDKENIKSICNW